MKLDEHNDWSEFFRDWIMIPRITRINTFLDDLIEVIILVIIHAWLVLFIDLIRVSYILPNRS